MLNDLRHAARALWRAPGFTATATLTLALGIGANATVFSLIKTVLFAPLPFREPHRVALLTEGNATSRVSVSYPNFLDWRARSRAFEDMAICLPRGSAVMAGDGRAEVLGAARSEARLFTMLGFQPAAGRLFTASEELPGAPAVALISYRLWQRKFAGAADVATRSVSLDGEPVSIVGVLPPAFRLFTADVVLPLVPGLTKGQLERGKFPVFTAYARLRDGSDFDRAQQEMTSIAADLEAQYPASNARMGVFVTPITDLLLGGARRILALLGGAVALLLLVACANVANVLLARGLNRERETAVRAALGAGRLRIVRLFLCEGAIIALLGAVMSLLLAAWGVRLARAMPALGLPRSADVAMDATVIAYAVALAAAAVGLFALAPAVQLSRVDVMRLLRLASHSGGVTRVGRRLRGALLAVEVGLSLMLLVGASLMLRSVAGLVSADLGYQPDGLLVAGINHSPDRYPDGESIRLFGDRVLDRVRTIPGVADAALVFPLTIAGITWNPRITFPEQPFPRGTEPSPLTSSVTGTFFETMRMPLRQGRLFGPEDRPGAPVAAVVNETFVRQLLKEGSPIGRRLSAIEIPQMSTMVVVGVVGDSRRGGLAAPVAPELYVSYAQMPVSDPTIVVRASSGDPLALARAVDAEVASIDPDVPTSLPRRVTDIVNNSFGDRRAIAILLSTFALLALGLTVLGIFGAVSYLVAQRTSEIGVRMALGADARAVTRLVVRSALTPVFVGLGLGAAATIPFGRLIRSFLFEVTPTDPASLMLATLALAAAALVAAYLPARRATRIEPLTALKN